MADHPPPSANSLESLEAQLAAAASPRQKADLLNAIAWELRDVDIARGKALTAEAYAIAEQEAYEKGMADSLIVESQYLFSNFVQAITNGLKALAVYESLNDPTGQSRALYTLCWAHWSIDNFTEAADAGQRALKLARANGDWPLEADILNNLGLTYKRAGNYELSYRMYADALAIYRQRGDRMRMGKVLNNTALAYSAQGNYAAALPFALECAEMRLNNTLIDGYNALSLGQIYAGLKQYDRALYFLPQALSIAKDQAFEALSLAALQFAGEVYLEQQELSQAIAFLQQAVAVGEGIHSKLFLFRCHEILAQIFERQGDLAAALFHYKQFHTIKEETFNENSGKRRQVLEIYHQTEITRRDAEIYQLRNVELEQEIAERKRAEQKLEQQATTDELTGIANRRQFLALAALELKRTYRMNHSMALALIDLDHFKLINDGYGHAAGDQALIAFAAIVRRNIREIDLLARFGGDEFVLLLPETSLSQAQRVVERFRRVLAAQPLVLEGHPAAITISVGISNAQSEPENLDQIIRRADQALYQAKQAGRNCIRLEPAPGAGEPDAPSG